MSDGGGGGTKFGEKLEVPPQLGRMLVLHNCHGKTNKLDRRSSHAGLMVNGPVEKWAFNLWFHEFPFSLSVDAERRASAKGYATCC